jgi:hypothetical protein
MFGFARGSVMSGKDGRSGTSASADPWAVPSLWVTRRLSVYAVGWCSSRSGWGEACASPRAKRCGCSVESADAEDHEGT